MRRTLRERSVPGAFGATALSALLLLGWSRELQVGWAVGAGVALLAAFALPVLARQPVRGRRLHAVALLALTGALFAAALYTWQFHRLATDWEHLAAARQQVLAGALSARMEDVASRGREAAERAAAVAAAQPPGEASDALFRGLSLIRGELRVDALAVYREGSNLLAWSGEHRGPIPGAATEAGVDLWFEERPLFSYLYFQASVPGRDEQVLAAMLVEAGVPDEHGGADIVSVAGAGRDALASFHGGGDPRAIWAMTAGGDTVVHARLAPLSQPQWRDTLERNARRVMLLLVGLSLLAGTAAWLVWSARRRLVVAASLPLVVILAAAAVAPVGSGDGLFSPSLFTLPLPGDLSLGRLLTLLLPAAALVAGSRLSWSYARWRVAATGAALALAFIYPAVIRLLLQGATPVLLQGTSAYWLGFQLVLVLTLTLATVWLLPRSGGAATEQHDSRPAGGAPTPANTRILFGAGLATSALMALALTAMVAPRGAVPVWTAAAWAIPLLLLMRAVGPLRGRPGSLLRWLAAGWLASTAVMPHLWQAHVLARLESAERDLQTLGVQADPALEYRLFTFSETALARRTAGEEGVQLLYRSWVASGLAAEGYPVRIMMWSPAGVQAMAGGMAVLPDVQMGSAPLPEALASGRLREMLLNAAAVGRPVGTPFNDQPDMIRLVTVPMPDSSLVAVAVPPRRSLERTSAIAPFLGAIAGTSTRLTVVDPRGLPAAPLDTIGWERTEQGWRSEATVQYPEGLYHAHLAVDFPSPGVRSARAALLVTWDLAILALLWLAGVAARGGSAVPRGAWAGWAGSFRARVTLALFGFFLVPTLVFGWVAYSALAGEVARAAQTVAQHSAAQAVREFQEGNPDLRDLAAHAGSDVLRYTGGELIDVSSREALELGVYEAWMPPHVFQRLDTGEEQEGLEIHRLGSQSYITAYHALRPSGTLGVPMSLTTGDTARRQEEFAHLVLFAVVLGGLLSLALSVAVGRTLAGPIGLLRRASAAVGAGSLRIRLPEQEGGEFGQVYASFNRMIRRLRRARIRELRTARVLAWGEMARQVAHEIKNPLTPIKLSVQHLRRAYNDRHPQFGSVLESNVDQILSEIDRLSDIARAFSRYGAPSLADGPLASVDVAGSVREALTLYRSGDRNVRYVDDIEPGLPPVQARANELKEVLLNLVENSRAALEADGVVVISAVRDEAHVRIEVSDNGPGIPDDVLQRMFEPHFSTRSSGTGLGLAIVRRLVESWGGTVTADSRMDSGTTVTVRLLVAPAGGGVPGA